MRHQPTPRTWVGTDAQVVRHVRVCGDGHLAAATRIELERQGIHRDSDYLLPSLRPALIIACADSEADQSFNDAAQQALAEGSPLLLCCLAGPVVRLGPLIEPSAFADPAWSQRPPAAASPNQASPLQGAPISASRSPQSLSQQAPPSSPPRASVSTPGSPASTSRQSATPTLNSTAPARPAHPAPRPRRRSHRSNPDKPESALHPDARLAALLVSAQALNFLLGARNQCVLDRVVELNPWSMESRGYRVFHN
jgi:hypothetical protein